LLITWEAVGSAAGERTAVGEETESIIAVRVGCLAVGMLWVGINSSASEVWEAGGWDESNEQAESALHNSQSPIKMICRIK